MRIGSLCSGYGGLDLAVEEFYGATTAWHCEYESAPSKILAHHWNISNHHDLTTTDWETVEPVDILTAGWPCQPWSVAGAQKGVEDERAIWPGVADAIRRLRPQHVVLENVPAIVVLGELARAVGDLASLGYDAQWQCVRASDVGAPHRRERCFIVARDTDSMAGGTLDRPSRALGQRRAIQRALRSDGTPVASEANHAGRGKQRRPLTDGARYTTTQRGRDAVADARSERLGEHAGGSPAEETGARGGDEPTSNRGPRTTTDWGPYLPAIQRWETVVGRRAPAPTEPGRNGPRLSPVLVEWMMGLPAGWVTDPAIGLTRNQQLKALGNGVVPQQALAALQLLSDVEIAA